MELEELKEKLADSKYDSSGLDPVQSCSSSCDFQLKDHAEGWKYWKTVFGEDNNGNRIDALFLSPEDNRVLFIWTEQYPDQIRKAGVEIIGGADIRNLEPITEEEWKKIADTISDHLDEIPIPYE